jgi:hypothetical protein
MASASSAPFVINPDPSSARNSGRLNSSAVTQTAGLAPSLKQPNSRYPAGRGHNSIRHTLDANRRRVR